MKKYNTFKVLGIVIILTILLSYFIPQTTVSYGEVASGNLNPTSIIDTFSNAITSFNVFVSQFIFILVLSVFYAILKKTGKYEEVENNIAAKFNNNKGLFIVLSILFFGIFTAILGDMLPMFIFVPLFIGVALKLGYSKTSSVAATIGAIIIGSTGSLNTAVINQVLYTEPGTNILYKIIIDLVGLISLIGFILIFNKPADNKKIETVKTSKQLPLRLAFIFIFIFVVLGMTPWSTYFTKFNTFTKLFQDVTEFKLFKVSLYSAFVGNSVQAWGTWQLFDLSVLLAVFGLILILIYKIKFNDFLELGAKTIKKALPYALIFVIANIVLVNVYSSGWFYTIIKGLSGSKFNGFAGALISALSAIVYPDYTYATQFSLTTVIYSISSKDFYGLLQVIFQAIYSAFLLVSPTSILILLGLYHLNISFKEWIKYIWKYFLLLISTIMVIICILWVGFNVTIIVSLLIIVSIVVLFLVKRINSVKAEITKETVKKVKEIKKETKNEEVKKTAPKKAAAKKTTKKTTTKKSNIKKK